MTNFEQSAKVDVFLTNNIADEAESSANKRQVHVNKVCRKIRIIHKSDRILRVHSTTRNAIHCIVSLTHYLRIWHLNGDYYS